MALAIRS